MTELPQLFLQKVIQVIPRWQSWKLSTLLWIRCRIAWIGRAWTLMAMVRSKSTRFTSSSSLLGLKVLLLASLHCVRRLGHPCKVSPRAKLVSHFFHLDSLFSLLNNRFASCWRRQPEQCNREFFELAPLISKHNNDVRIPRSSASSETAGVLSSTQLEVLVSDSSFCFSQSCPVRLTSICSSRDGSL